MSSPQIGLDPWLESGLQPPADDPLFAELCAELGRPVLTVKSAAA